MTAQREISPNLITNMNGNYFRLLSLEIFHNLNIFIKAFWISFTGPPLLEAWSIDIRNNTFYRGFTMGVIIHFSKCILCVRISMLCQTGSYIKGKKNDETEGLPAAAGIFHWTEMCLISIQSDFVRKPRRVSRGSCNASIRSVCLWNCNCTNKRHMNTSRVYEESP